MATKVRACIAFCLMTIAGVNLGGCSDPGGGNSSSTATTPTSTHSATSSALTISGNPAQGVAVGSSYDFRPTVKAAPGAILTFSIQNQPSWATFDPTTGTLSGTPAAANVGMWGTISISVTDGTTATALAAFSIDVTQKSGVASLTWSVPPTLSNGALDIAGYHIYFGDSPTNLNRVISVDGVAATGFVINDLPSGTWYFGVTSYNAALVESSMSAIVSASI